MESRRRQLQQQKLEAQMREAREKGLSEREDERKINDQVDNKYEVYEYSIKEKESYYTNKRVGEENHPLQNTEIELKEGERRNKNTRELGMIQYASGGLDNNRTGFLYDEGRNDQGIGEREGHLVRYVDSELKHKESDQTNQNVYGEGFQSPFVDRRRNQEQERIQYRQRDMKEQTNQNVLVFKEHLHKEFPLKNRRRMIRSENLQNFTDEREVEEFEKQGVPVRNKEEYSGQNFFSEKKSGYNEINQRGTDKERLYSEDQSVESESQWEHPYRGYHQSGKKESYKGDEHTSSNERLLQFATIATGPQSPLLHSPPDWGRLRFVHVYIHS